MFQSFECQWGDIGGFEFRQTTLKERISFEFENHVLLAQSFMSANELETFSLIHQYDKPKVFKESFQRFLKNKEDMVIREKRSLIGRGYSGDINDKMYRSARYYFKNKDHTIEKFKDKKQWISKHKQSQLSYISIQQVVIFYRQILSPIFERQKRSKKG